MLKNWPQIREEVRWGKHRRPCWDYHKLVEFVRGTLKKDCRIILFADVYEDDHEEDNSPVGEHDECSQNINGELVSYCVGRKFRQWRRQELKDPEREYDDRYLQLHLDELIVPEEKDPCTKDTDYYYSDLGRRVVFRPTFRKCELLYWPSMEWQGKTEGDEGEQAQEELEGGMYGDVDDDRLFNENPHEGASSTYLSLRAREIKLVGPDLFNLLSETLILETDTPLQEPLLVPGAANLLGSDRRSYLQIPCRDSKGIIACAKERRLPLWRLQLNPVTGEPNSDSMPLANLSIGKNIFGMVRHALEIVEFCGDESVKANLVLGLDPKPVIVARTKVPVRPWLPSCNTSTQLAQSWVNPETRKLLRWKPESVSSGYTGKQDPDIYGHFVYQEVILTSPNKTQKAYKCLTFQPGAYRKRPEFFLEQIPASKLWCRLPGTREWAHDKDGLALWENNRMVRQPCLKGSVRRFEKLSDDELQRLFLSRGTSSFRLLRDGEEMGPNGYHDFSTDGVSFKDRAVFSLRQCCIPEHDKKSGYEPDWDAWFCAQTNRRNFYFLKDPYSVRYAERIPAIKKKKRKGPRFFIHQKKSWKDGKPVTVWVKKQKPSNWWFHVTNWGTVVPAERPNPKQLSDVGPILCNSKNINPKHCRMDYPGSERHKVGEGWSGSTAKREMDWLYREAPCFLSKWKPVSESQARKLGTCWGAGWDGKVDPQLEAAEKAVIKRQKQEAALCIKELRIHIGWKKSKPYLVFYKNPARERRIMLGSAIGKKAVFIDPYVLYSSLRRMKGNRDVRAEGYPPRPSEQRWVVRMNHLGDVSKRYWDRKSTIGRLGV